MHRPVLLRSLTTGRLARLLLAALALSACGSAPVLAPASPAAASAAVASPSPVASSPRPRPSRSSPTPTRGPAGPSASPRVTAASPAGRVVPAAQGDVDGDGEADEIAYEGAQAVVTLSGGGVVRASTAADIDADPPQTAGVEDLDRDGRAEVFVKVGQGASTGFLLVLRYDGARLRALEQGGRPRLLAYGGSVGQGDGFSCTAAGRLVVRQAVRQADDSYAVSAEALAVHGAALVQVDRQDEDALADGDPKVAAAYVVDCRSVGEGDEGG